MTFADKSRPGGISERGAKLQAVVNQLWKELDAGVDQALATFQERATGVFWERVAVVVRNYKLKQNFMKAGQTLMEESRKRQKYPLKEQRECLEHVARLYDHAAAQMRAEGNRLTRETDEKNGKDA